MNIYTGMLLTISETLTDNAGNPVTNATVVATLFYQRDRLFPDITPGTAITGFTNVSMSNSSPASNIYTATVQPINPSLMPPCGDYVLVIDASTVTNASGVYHKEEPSVVQIGAPL